MEWWLHTFSVEVAYIYIYIWSVRDLDQKVWQVSILRSTRLDKAQNKQAGFV